MSGDSALRQLECISVLDLPQLYQKPSFSSLQNALSLAALTPDSWDTTEDAQTNITRIDEDGLPQYLTKIIGSSLSWLSSDADREAIWEAASQRLTERSGRSGMSSMQRTFSVPIADEERVQIKLNEPALVQDQLGHKTWLASYVLAKKLHHLFRECCSEASQEASRMSSPSKLRVLELGAGTGLCGLAAAACLKSQAECLLTDLPEIVPNLEKNIGLNTSTNVHAQALDWSKVPKNVPSDQKFEVVIAADSLYVPEHVQWLSNAIVANLRPSAQARLFTCLPIRPDSLDFHGRLNDVLTSQGLFVVQQGHELGMEDWYTGKERQEVQCWWAVWTWKPYFPR